MQFFRQHWFHSPLVWLLIVAMLFRVSIPVGYMPDWKQNGVFAVKLCTVQGIKYVNINLPGKPLSAPVKNGEHDASAHTLCMLGAVSAFAVDNGPSLATIFLALFFVSIAAALVPVTLARRRYFCLGSPRAPPVFS